MYPIRDFPFESVWQVATYNDFEKSFDNVNGDLSGIPYAGEVSMKNV